MGEIIQGLAQRTLVERKRNGKVPSQYFVLTWLVACVADIATKLPARCTWPHQLREIVWQTSTWSRPGVWRERPVAQASFPRHERGAGCPMGRNFLRCVQFSAEHWPNDGVESLWTVFERLRGKTRRATLQSLLSLPSPLGDCMFIRHTDLETWRCASNCRRCMQ